jgi:hypothetical protein
MLVTIDSKCVVDDEGCERNLRKVLARNLSYCKESPERAGERLAVVAAGPSVKDFIDEIKTYEHIWAINGAYNFLLDRGITPSGFFGTDPLPGLAAYVTRIAKETTCYISGLCDEAVYETLKDRNVQVWFPQQDSVRFPDDLLKGTDLIPGGTTAISRAPFLARTLGFKDVTLYGADSSYDVRFLDDGWPVMLGRYCYEDNTYPEDSKAEIKRVVTTDGKGPFFTETPLLQQVSQLGVMHTHQTWGVKFNIRCHGLMDAYLKAPLELENGEIVASQ